MTPLPLDEQVIYIPLRHIHQFYLHFPVRTLYEMSKEGLVAPNCTRSLGDQPQRCHHYVHLSLVKGEIMPSFGALLALPVSYLKPTPKSMFCSNIQLK